MHAQKIPFIYLTIRKNTFSKASDGTILHAIFLAVSHRRKIRYLNSGVKVRTDQLENSRVINHPAEQELNLKLTEMIQNLHAFIYMNNLFECTPQEILNRYQVSQEKTTSFEIYTRQLAGSMLKAGKYSSGTSLLTMLKALEKVKVKISGFRDLSLSKLNDIAEKWNKLGLKANTQGVYFRDIRLVYNRAILDDMAYQSDYPFRRFKIPKQVTAKRNIVKSDLLKVMNLKLSDLQECSRDMFLLSLFLVGINFKDLLTVKSTQVVNNRLIYHRSKTGKLISIKIEEEAMEIIQKYKGESLLLNALEIVSPEKGKKRPLFMKIMDRTNQQLKIIARKSGVNIPLSTYYARHTWATIAAQQGVSRDVIGLALGHQSGSITDVYIEWDPQLIDQANRKVIDFIFL
jgi:integrase